MQNPLMDKQNSHGESGSRRGAYSGRHQSYPSHHPSIPSSIQSTIHPPRNQSTLMQHPLISWTDNHMEIWVRSGTCTGRLQSHPPKTPIHPTTHLPHKQLIHPDAESFDVMTKKLTWRLGIRSGPGTGSYQSHPPHKQSTLIHVMAKKLTWRLEFVTGK